jgi:S1/P1 Nuclease
MKKLLNIAGALALFCATNVYAWNSYGHMTVAAVAWENLTPEARKKATALLQLNPDYKHWIVGVPAAKRAQVAFVVAATWPDLIKSETGYQNDGEEPKEPGASKNEGYTDTLQHRYWHYIDLPFSPDGTPLVQPKSPNAKTQIATFRATLSSSTASAALKSYDLAWLLHLVGDVHQPLHATSRFTKDLPQGDQGGNLVMLCSKPKCRAELHAFWDSTLGTSKDPNAAIRKAAKLTAADPQAAAIADESAWINESFEAAKATAYAPPVGVGAGPFALDAEYRKNARAVAIGRVALAGARLANLLNDALK